VTAAILKTNILHASTVFFEQALTMIVSPSAAAGQHVAMCSVKCLLPLTPLAKAGTADLVSCSRFGH